jgi:hypothetical protein
MSCRNIRVRVCAALAVAVIALPGAALAQFPPPPAPVQERWPEARPSGEPSPPPPARPAPKRAATPDNTAPDGEQPPAAKNPPPAPANVVACSGVFAKESTHIKLAMKYDSRNITSVRWMGRKAARFRAPSCFRTSPAAVLR